MEQNTAKWTDSEVQALLHVYGDCEVQRELDSSMRNEKIYLKISTRLSELGITHSSKQCREKLKKLKQDYKKLKDHNSKSGGDRKIGKWFLVLDAILGHRPAYSGNVGTKGSTTVSESAVDYRQTASCDTSSTEDLLCEPHVTETNSTPIAASSPSPTKSHGKRKRDSDFLEAVREMEERHSDILRQEYEQRECFLQQMLQHDAREAAEREREFALLREDAAESRRQQNAFQEGFLAVFQQLVEVLDKRNAAKGLKEERKRDSNFLEAVREMEKRDLAILKQGCEQREHFFQQLLQHDARKAAEREMEFALLREDAAESRRQQNTFQEGFLAIFQQFVNVLDKRTEPAPPPLD